MQFLTLRAEMVRHKVSKDDIAEHLGQNEKTTRYRLSGKLDFTCREMKKIRDKFFPKLTIGYLFFDDEEEEDERRKTGPRYLKLIK